MKSWDEMIFVNGRVIYRKESNGSDVYEYLQKVIDRGWNYTVPNRVAETNVAVCDNEIESPDEALLCDFIHKKEDT